MKGHATIGWNHRDARARLTPAGRLELNSVATAGDRLKSAITVLGLTAMGGPALPRHRGDFYGPVSRCTPSRANLNDHQRVREGWNRAETEECREGDS